MKRKTIEEIQNIIYRNIKGVKPIDGSVLKISGKNIWYIDVIKSAIEESKRELEDNNFTIIHVFDCISRIVVSYNNENTYYNKQIKKGF